MNHEQKLEALLCQEGGMAPEVSVRSGSGAEPVVSRIECDRFCDECGFNMRTLPVFVDERTRLLLSRCTECGRIHPAREAVQAGRAWFSRLGPLVVAAWMLVILLSTFLLGMLETGMQIVTLDELTESSPGGRVVQADVEAYPEFMATVLGVSASAGFVMISLYACAAHHWKRVFHAVLAAVVPLVPLAIASRAWSHEAPQLMQWGLGYMLLHASVQVGAGLMGALFGRPVARFLCLALLPPRTRGVMSFLWIADGKPPPGGASPRDSLRSSRA